MTVKDAFVQKAITEYMRMTIADMRRAIVQKKVGESGAASRSLDSTTGPSHGELIFADYLRFVDMGVGKGQPLGGLKAMKVALKSSNKSGYSLEKNRGRKAKKVYSKVAYRNLSWLQGKILYGYSEEAIRLIKAEMEGTAQP